MVEREKRQQGEYRQDQNALPCVCDTISVESLVDIQQIIVAQRKEYAEFLQDGIHRSYWISETR